MIRLRRWSGAGAGVGSAITLGFALGYTVLGEGRTPTADEYAMCALIGAGAGAYVGFVVACVISTWE